MDFGVFSGLAEAWRWPLAALLLGLAAGWLANRAIHVLPSDEPHDRPFGACQVCGARQPWFYLLSIVGWLAQGARCRRCRARLSAVAPTIEVVNAALWALLVVRFGLSTHAVVLMVFVTALLALVVIDFHHYLLPDAITLSGMVGGVAATQLPGWPVSLLDSTLSAGIGYFLMMALAKVAARYYGEEALGQGDWKMVAMLGACLGSTKTLETLLIANAGGALVGLLLVATLGERGRGKLPLGTFMGAAGIAVAFW
jgi:leader peptidase (prepilin peptidase)/N-methyltransferase